MKVNYSEIRNVYSIKVKTFEPDVPIKGYILALHGFCGDMESSVIKALAKRMTPHGFAVVAFNFPGHGTSEADEYFSLYNCRQDMMEVIKYANNLYEVFYPTDVFATSFGGYVTLLNNDNLPSSTALVLRAPAINMKASFEKFTDDMDAFRRNGLQEMGFDRKLNVPYSFYEELVSNDIHDKEFEAALQGEVLIIHGDKDDIVLPDDMQMFYWNNPMIKLEVIEGADHRFKGNGHLKNLLDMAENHFLHVVDVIEKKHRKYFEQDD